VTRAVTAQKKILAIRHAGMRVEKRSNSAADFSAFGPLTQFEAAFRQNV